MKVKTNLISFLIILIFSLPICFFATGCSIGTHTHTPSNVWDYDQHTHWRNCRENGCEIKINDTTHLWSQKIILVPATYSHGGVEKYTCKVCYTSKQIKTSPLAVLSESNIYDISELTKEYDGKPVSEPTFKTVGDGDISLKWFEGETLLDAPPSSIGTYKLTITIAETPDFKEFSIDKTFEIKQKEIRIENLPLVYDRTNEFEIDNLSSHGVVDGEELDLKFIFENANVNSKLIGVELSGEHKDNYFAGIYTINAHIIKAEPSIKLTNGITSQTFNLRYGEEYLNILQSNEKGERLNGFDGKPGTFLNVDEFVNEEDILITYHDENGTIRQDVPLLAGNYMFKIRINETKNYSSAKLEVPYSISQAKLDISSLVNNISKSQYTSNSPNAIIKLGEEQGILNSDSVFLNIKYFGSNIGDQVTSAYFVTTGNKSYLNYELVGQMQGEVVGDISIEYGTQKITAFVKLNEKTLFANVECTEILNISHLEHLTSNLNSISKIVFKNIENVDIEFINFDQNNNLCLNPNLSSGGIGADNFKYTDHENKWVGTKIFIDSTQRLLTLTLVCNQE